MVGMSPTLTQPRRQTVARSRGVSRRGFLRRAVSLAATGLLSPGGGRLVQAAAGTLRHPLDPSRPTPFEQLHLPVLRMPSFTHNGAHVPLVVGMSHPMEPDHYIRSLQILNASDPIPSKGTFTFTPANGQAYLATQVRIHSGMSSVLVIAECNRHGRWGQRQTITIAAGGGGCATSTAGRQSQRLDDAIRPPVVRLPEVVSRAGMQPGDIIRVQLKCKHPNRTGLAFHDGKFFQAADPFYIQVMRVFYGGRLASRYDMTPALSDNPFITFKLKVTEAWPLRLVLTNNRGQRFEAMQDIIFS
ncbi:hypothetical protein NKDENANG_01753 [Candidatus Entotheonellaceae bacterium PAL068K]